MEQLNGHLKTPPPRIGVLGPSCGFCDVGDCWDCPHHARELIKTETGRPLCYASVCRWGGGGLLYNERDHGDVKDFRQHGEVSHVGGV